MADLPNGKVCVASYHMWRLYPTRITTRSISIVVYIGLAVSGFQREDYLDIGGRTFSAIRPFCYHPSDVKSSRYDK